jgi:ABC-2 type transport system ATP-binding protein
MSLAVPNTSRTSPGLEGAPAVEVRRLRKEFARRARGDRRLARKRRFPALDEITFTIARGECVAILGQNGSGKSTLVRLLSTLLLHDGGDARIFGHDAFADTRAVRRLVNRVSVEASFFKRMSAEENLSYAARFYGLTRADTCRRIPQILTRVGFPAERRGEPMENLSRGMQQKVALARALLTAPMLLLLDEPTTGLDPRSKLEVQSFIREILADRVGILDRGGLLSLEPVPDLLRHYDAATLEEAFFAATGHAIADEAEKEAW